MSWISVGNQEAQPKRISSFEQKGGAISEGIEKTTVRLVINKGVKNPYWNIATEEEIKKPNRIDASFDSNKKV